MQGSVSQVRPDEGDAFVADDDVKRGYSASLDGKFLGYFSSMDAGVGAILDAMNAASYWPNVWYVNDHGNQTLLEVREVVSGGYSDFTWSFTDTAWV